MPGGAQPASVHSKAPGSSSRDGPRMPSGCQRLHGSGSSAPSTRYAVVGARQRSTIASYTPKPASSSECSRPSTRSAIRSAPGAQTRNSARPSPSGKAPRRRSNGRWLTGTRTASSRVERCSSQAMQMFLATLLATAAVAAPVTEPATNVTATERDAERDASTRRRRSTSSTAPRPRTASRRRRRPSRRRPGLGHRLRPDRRDDVPLPDRSSTASRERRTFTTAANPKPPVDLRPAGARHRGRTRRRRPPRSNANGSATTYRIEYGTSTRYGSETAPAQAPSTGTPSVSVKLDRPAAVHALPLAHGGHQRGRHHARRRPLVPDRPPAHRRQPLAVAQDGAVGRRRAPRRPRQRRRRVGDDRRAPAAAAAGPGLRGGGHRPHGQRRRLPVHDPQAVDDHALPRRHAHAGGRHQPRGHGSQPRPGRRSARASSRASGRASRARSCPASPARSRSSSTGPASAGTQVRTATLTPADETVSRYASSSGG